METGQDVKQAIVLAETASAKCAFTELPSHADNTAPANVFCSHAWRYRFRELTAALRHWAEKQGADFSTLYVWIDLFSVNQHQALSVPQEWWSEVFVRGIRATKRVVLVLAPWSEPVPLRRAWCLWDVFNVVAAGVEFSVALSAEEEKSLEEAVGSDWHDIVPTLCKIDAAKSEASRKEDLDMILDAVRASEGGFGAVNGTVVGLMRDWLAEKLEEMASRARKGAQAEDAVESEAAMLLMAEAGVVFSALGRHKDALRLKEEVMGLKKAKLGPDHPETLKSMNNLASTYRYLGRHEDARRLHEVVMGLSKAKLGPDHPSTLISMGNLA